MARYHARPRYRGKAYDIATRTHDIARGGRYRAPRTISHTRTISIIVGARGDIGSHPALSRIALAITRVGTIPRPARDIVSKRDNITTRTRDIARGGRYRRPAYDIAHTHDNMIAARYRTRVVMARYREPVHDIVRLHDIVPPPRTTHIPLKCYVAFVGMGFVGSRAIPPSLSGSE